MMVCVLITENVFRILKRLILNNSYFLNILFAILNNMKRDLNEILAFVAVAKEGHFSKAAAKLGLPKSSVSRKISLLEERLQTKLIERTTRKSLLTEAGQLYFEKCERALDDISEVEKTFDETSKTLRGTLRVTCPIELAPRIARRLHGDFSQNHPELKIHLWATNQVLDLAKEQIDLAIRPYQLAESNMHYLHLGEIKWGLYASSQWIKSYKLSDLCKDLSVPVALDPWLKKHWLHFQAQSRSTPYAEISFFQNTDEKRARRKLSNFRVRPQFVSDSLFVLKEMVVFHQGIAALPDFLIEDEVKSNMICKLMPGWSTKIETLAALYLNHRYRPVRVTALLDHLKSLKHL